MWTSSLQYICLDLQNRHVSLPCLRSRCLCWSLGVTSSLLRSTLLWTAWGHSSWSETCLCPSCWTKNSLSRLFTKVSQKSNTYGRSVCTWALLLYVLQDDLLLTILTGSTYGLSYQTRIDEDNCYALLPNGMDARSITCHYYQYYTSNECQPD